MDKSTMWSLAAKNGLILSLVTILTELITSSFTLPKWVSIIITLVKLFLICFLLYKFMKSYTENCEGAVPYSKSYTYGFIICLCSTIVCTLFSFIDYTWINPQITETMTEAIQTMAESQPMMSGVDLDKLIGIMPQLIIASLFIQYLFYGAIIPLIIAAYTKRDNVFSNEESE